MAIAPDGSRLAVAIDSGSGGTAYDVWVIDLTRGAASRVTFGEVTEGWPVWSPDGRTIAYGATGNGAVLAAYRKPASGTGAEQLVYTDPAMITIPSDWSPDGKLLLLESQAGTRDNSDLITVPVDTPGAPTTFIKTPKPIFENHARFSPDGSWIAYESNESTRPEVYVQAFPPSERRWQISTAGGQSPMWRADAKEIFFTAPDDTLYAVPVHLGAGTIDAGDPVKLFQQPLNHLGRSPRGRWIVSRDGQRFLLNVLIEDQDVKGAQVVLNWAGGLNK
jgi:Tol biopolymer transport system component